MNEWKKKLQERFKQKNWKEIKVSNEGPMQFFP